jgi:hypothetical protein
MCRFNTFTICSPFNLTLSAKSLPKFKDHLPKFLGNDTITTKEHLVAFSNACQNIWENDNDTFIHLFVNSLERKVATYFFDLPPKNILYVGRIGLLV